MQRLFIPYPALQSHFPLVLGSMLQFMLLQYQNTYIHMHTYKHTHTREKFFETSTYLKMLIPLCEMGSCTSLPWKLLFILQSPTQPPFAQWSLSSFSAEKINYFSLLFVNFVHTLLHIYICTYTKLFCIIYFSVLLFICSLNVTPSFLIVGTRY